MRGRTVGGECGVGDGVGMHTRQRLGGLAAPAEALREGYIAWPLEARCQQCSSVEWVPGNVQARWGIHRHLNAICVVCITN